MAELVFMTHAWGRFRVRSKLLKNGFGRQWAPGVRRLHPHFLACAGGRWIGLLLGMLNLETVPRPDGEYIRSMFDRMAERYDTFTFCMSFGGAKALRNEALKGIR